MRKRKSKSIGVMTSLFFILLLTGAVSTAAETQGGVAGNLIDKNRTGSISIRYQDKEDDSSPVAGAVFTYYKIGEIADQSGDGISEGMQTLIPGLVLDPQADPSEIRKTVVSYYELHKDEIKNSTPETAGAESPDSLHQGSDIPVEDADKPVGETEAGTKLAWYRAETDKDGDCRTIGMKQGVYLAVEEKAADGHLSSEPFLFTLPYSGAALGNETGVSNKRWYYDVIAEPKPKLVKEAEPSPTPKPTAAPKQSNEKAGRPQTGDSANPVLYLVLLVSSFTACVAILDYRRKAGERI